MKAGAETVVVSAGNHSRGWRSSEQAEIGLSRGSARTSAGKQKKRGEGKYELVSLSCVFVPEREGKKEEFVCTICRHREKLGKTSKAIVRVDFIRSGEVLCHRCADVIIDIMRYGQVVIGNAFEWKLRSRMTGMSAVFDDIQCAKCLQRSMTHVVAKFNGLERDGVVKRKAVKCCSKCFMTFMYGVRATKLYEERLEYVPQIFASKRVRS